MVVKRGQILLLILQLVCFIYLNDRVPLRGECSVVCLGVLGVGSIEGGKLIRVDLSASDSTRELTFLYVVCVKLNVIGENASMAFLTLA